MKNSIIIVVVLLVVGFIVFNFVSRSNNYGDVEEINSEDTFTSDDFKLKEDVSRQVKVSEPVVEEEVVIEPIQPEAEENKNQSFPPSDFIYWAGFYFRIPEGWTGQAWMYGNNPSQAGQVGVRLTAPEDLGFEQIFVGGPQSSCGELNNPNYENFVCVTDEGILSGPQDSQYISGLPVSTLSTNQEVITQFNAVVEELEETYF